MLNKEKEWYDENIEDPLKELMYVLRNNGFNTECSCGHDMYIQCQYVADESIKKLHDLLYLYFHENGDVPNYQIAVHYNVIDGHVAQSYINIEFKKSLV